MSTPREQDCPLNEQAVGWALHALEPDEEMAVLLHLPQCASCREAVRDAESVMVGLGGSVEQIEPPRGLRGRLMAEVSDTSQQPRLASISPTVRTPRHRVGAVRPPDAATRRRSWLSTRGRRLIAASLAVVAVLSIGALAVRTNQLQQERDAQIAQADGLAGLLSQLDRPGVQHALLAAPDGTTTAAVLVVDGQRQVFTIGLPANGDARTYVLWGLKAAGSPQALGTFDVADADQGFRAVGGPAAADSYLKYAVSIEPGRVAPATPSGVVAAGQVRA